MLDFLFFAAFIYGVRTAVYGISVIREKNYSGGAGLFALSLLTFAAAYISAAEFFR